MVHVTPDLNYRKSPPPANHYRAATLKVNIQWAKNSSRRSPHWVCLLNPGNSRSARVSSAPPQAVHLHCTCGLCRCKCRPGGLAARLCLRHRCRRTGCGSTPPSPRPKVCQRNLLQIPIPKDPGGCSPPNCARQPRCGAQRSNVGCTRGLARAPCFE